MIRQIAIVAAILALGLSASAQTRPGEQPIPSGGGYGGGYGGMGGYAQPRNEDQAYRQLSLRWFADGPVPDLNSLSERLRKQIPADAAKELKLGDKLIEQLGRDGTFHVMIKPAENSWDIQLTLTFVKAEHVPVDRLMDAIVDRLRAEVIVSAQRQADDRLARLQARQRELQDETAKYSGDLTAMVAKLRDVTGRLAVSPEILHSAMAKLDDERQTLEIDKEDQAVRYQALRDSIAAQSEKLKEQIRNDTVSAELEKAVQAREQEHAMFEKMYKAGAAAQSEMAGAISDLANARARLAERRESLATSGPGQLLGVWNKELLNLSIEMRQKAARLGAVEASLKKLRAAVPLLEEVQRVEQKRDEAKKQADELGMQILAVQKENRRLPVLITTQQ